MTNKLLHVQYERNAHCRSCSPGATSACHICNPIWSQADWGRPFLLHRKFINIQMWILPPACCLRTSWTAKHKKTGAYLLPTRKRQSKKSTQWQGLGPAYFFCENVLFSIHFRQTSRARFIALKVASLQYPKIIAPNSTTVTSFHTYNPSCSSSSSRHASPCSVQQTPQHQKEPDNLVVQALKQLWCSSTYWPACNMQVVKITLFFLVGGLFFFQNMHLPQCTLANRHQDPVATPQCSIPCPNGIWQVHSKAPGESKVH